MKKSESVKSLAASLSKFQEEVKNPANTADNPFFKSKYAPLSDILNNVRPLLSKNGLSILQAPSGDGENIIITTMLLHTSGEYIEFDPLILKADKPTAQGAGSAITYARRYAISAILGISSEDDDDGNHAENINKEASKKAPAKVPEQPKPSNKISKEQAKRMFALAKGNADTVKKAMAEFKYEKSEQISKEDYNKICTRIEEMAASS